MRMAPIIGDLRCMAPLQPIDFIQFELLVLRRLVMEYVTNCYPEILQRLPCSSAIRSTDFVVHSQPARTPAARKIRSIRRPRSPN